MKVSVLEHFLMLEGSQKTQIKRNFKKTIFCPYKGKLKILHLACTVRIRLV